MPRTTLLPAAALVAIGGLIHLQLWSGGYRGIPVIGPWFVANAVASAVIAIALVAAARRPVALAGVVLSLASLAALVLSRTIGLFGFLETTWTDQAVAAVAAEVGAFVALAVALARRPPSARIRALPATPTGETGHLDQRQAA